MQTALHFYCISHKHKEKEHQATGWQINTSGTEQTYMNDMHLAQQDSNP